MNFVLLILFVFSLLSHSRTIALSGRELQDDSSLNSVPDVLKKDFFDNFDSKYAYLKQKSSSTLTQPSKKSLGNFFAEKLSENLVDILQAQIDYYNKNKNEALILNESISNDAKIFRELGDKRCSLINHETNERKPICPFHFQIKYRPNMYPRLRLFAKCNCKDCLFKATFGDEVFSWSKCEPVYFLMPTLIREPNGDWKFVLEQVPVSCRCTINFRTF